MYKLRMATSSHAAPTCYWIENYACCFTGRFAAWGLLSSYEQEAPLLRPFASQLGTGRISADIFPTSCLIFVVLHVSRIIL